MRFNFFRKLHLTAIKARSIEFRRFSNWWQKDRMSNNKEAASSSSSLERHEEEEFVYGAGSGWVEARTTCDHLLSLSSDLTQIPTPDTPCSRCDHPAENWLCLSCKDVFCSRFVNKHMLQHYQENGHCLALSYSDLSVWCFSCDAYLDVQAILQLRPVYEIAHLLKFKEAPPFRAIECLQVSFDQGEPSHDTVILRAYDGNVTF